MYIEIFTAGFAIMVTSLSGVVFMWYKFKDVLQKNLKFLVTFAIGVFSVTLYLMLRETLHLQANIGIIALAAALGALTLEILQRLIPEAHHHHGSDDNECCGHEHESAPKMINPKRILLGDAIHNIGDGIMLVPAFLISFSVGLSLTIGIILHEMIQEISEFFILKEAGYSTKKALLSNLLVSSTVFIGIAISLLVATVTDYTYLLISFATGAMLYIILRDLLPHTIERIRHNGGMMVHILLLALGIILTLTLVNMVPHDHDVHIGDTINHVKDL